MVEPSKSGASDHGPRPLRIGVLGPGRCGDETGAIATRVGRLIAEAGAVLICGGRTGVMEAAAGGAAGAGGIVVGILPSEDASQANPFVTVPIVTGMGNARNAINVLTAEAVIAIAGGPGTLSEIALAVKTGTPVIGLGTWEASLDSVPLRIHVAGDADDAVRKALEMATRRRRHPAHVPGGL